jgi:hypothetical protein
MRILTARDTVVSVSSISKDATTNLTIFPTSKKNPSLANVGWEAGAMEEADKSQ